MEAVWERHAMCESAFMVYWCNATEKGPSKYSEENLSQCHFVPHGKAKGWAQKPRPWKGRWQTPWAMAWTTNIASIGKLQVTFLSFPWARQLSRDMRLMCISYAMKLTSSRAQWKTRLCLTIAKTRLGNVTAAKHLSYILPFYFITSKSLRPENSKCNKVQIFPVHAINPLALELDI